ncbi:hypothetical protein NM208_g3441 [Fusarium decemcellulare]|uniref:Uncharacterized protein n=1 Tax=Fusarium decemcellulare TaxID=57161 RepID=A0ACC1SP94_9HYPO|nr:hypothetical protein NM208_g3441 [Fusarium decemcellulare]
MTSQKIADRADSSSLDEPLTVDLSAFTSNGDATSRRQTADELHEKLKINGFVGITGHGVSPDLLTEAFATSKKFFDLPYQDKMKAPHPDAPVPHRGYSGPGREYESFEMGSEENKREPNIWPPEEVYPGFRDFLVKFYWELNKTSLAILDALIMSLDLTEDEAKTVRALHPGHDHQLRLLHYPPMDEATAADKYSARIGAHRDWSSFTILFQDANGGLKYFDRPSETFRDAIPKEGVLYMNIGDMFERVSNGECASLLVEIIVSNGAFYRGIYPSALHEVVVRNPGQARYSIPYFMSPIGEGIIEPQPSLVEKVESRLFDPVSMMEYSKTMFERINVYV